MQQSFSLLILFSILFWQPQAVAKSMSINVDLPKTNSQIYLPLITNDSVSQNSCIYCYYVDSVGGSDDNLGTSEDKPWKTLKFLKYTNYLPGSVFHFKRGSFWNEELWVNNSGVEGLPIIYTTYGSGVRPIISNSGKGLTWTTAIFIQAKWIVVEGLIIKDTPDSGVFIAEGSDHNVVRNMEINNVGEGVSIHGQNNLITQNYIHDLHMENNTLGGIDDDYGAIGIVLSGSNNEVSYNNIINCISPSYDFGVDGGAIELYGITNNNFIHDNLATGNAGFMEVGVGSAQGTIVSNNVSRNNGYFSVIHLTGKFASEVTDFRIEKNTIVEESSDKPGWVIFGFDGEPTPDIFSIKNNIVSVENFLAISNRSGFMHTGNLYDLKGRTKLGFTLGQGEQLVDLP